MKALEVINRYKEREEKLSARRMRNLRKGIKEAKTYFEYWALSELISLIIRSYPEEEEQLKTVLNLVTAKMNSLQMK